MSKALVEQNVHLAVCECGNTFHIADFGDPPDGPARKPRKVPRGMRAAKSESVEVADKAAEEGAFAKTPDHRKRRSKALDRPVRILPTCDWVYNDHQDGIHVPSDAGCALCQRASLRSRRRAKVTSRDHERRITLGEYSVDLLVRIGEIWSYSLVLGNKALKDRKSADAGKQVLPALVDIPITEEERAKKRKICVATTLVDKSAPSIKRGLFRSILVAEYVWVSPCVRRIHSDQEPGVLANQEALHENAILLTLTEGHASKDNPVAEGAISYLSSAARTALEAASENLSKEVKEFLYMYAVEWAAVLWSAKSAEECGETRVKVRVKDVIPFMSGVLWREGPGHKAEKDSPSGKFGFFLVPSMIVPGGSVIITAEPGEPTRIVVATTVRQHSHEGKLIFPKKGEISVPKELRGRPKKGVAKTEGPKRGRGRPRKDAVPKGLIAELKQVADPELFAALSTVLEGDMPTEDACVADEQGYYAVQDKPFDIDIEWTVENRYGTEIDVFEGVDDLGAGGREVTEEGPPEAFSAVRVLREVEAHVTQAVPLKEARKRPGYRPALAKEIGRMLQYRAWGLPAPKSRVSKHARIYKAAPRHAVKHKEMPVEDQIDKCRVVVIGNIRILPSGKIHLDRWYRRKGEFWAPVGSLAAFRLMIALCVIQALSPETIDLQSGYLQTRNQDEELYIELAEEIRELLPDDWQRAMAEAARIDREEGGDGSIVFPVEGNMYGEAGAGTSFINQFQDDIVDCEYTRCTADPAFFFKKSEESKKVQPLVTYVDDLGNGRCHKEKVSLWDKLRAKGWIFDPEMGLRKFLGIVVNILSPRCIELSQEAYLGAVIERHEKRHNVTVKERKTLPESVPVPGDEATEKDGVRSDVGGMMWASRGTRPDLARGTTAIASCANRYVPASHDPFLTAMLGYAKSTLSRVMRFDATGLPTDLTEWGIGTWPDSDYRPARADVGPRCQSGVMLCLAPLVSLDGGLVVKKEGLLAWDWASTGQRFAKLSIAEGEAVALCQAARAGIGACTVWCELVRAGTGGLEWRVGRDVDDRDVLVRVEIPPHEVVRLFEDNAAALAACERGFSSSFAYFSRTYAVNITWPAERARTGELVMLHEHEESARMLSDCLTKMVAPKALIERGILSA